MLRLKLHDHAGAANPVAFNFVSGAPDLTSVLSTDEDSSDRVRESHSERIATTMALVSDA
jgi:hypothetical protein